MIAVGRTEPPGSQIELRVEVCAGHMGIGIEEVHIIVKQHQLDRVRAVDPRIVYVVSQELKLYRLKSWIEIDEVTDTSNVDHPRAIIQVS